MYNEPIADTSFVACPHCDLLQRLPELAPGASARCPRCDKELWRRREDSLNRTLALTLGAALLYIVANSVPMLGLTIVGRAASTTVIGGAEHLWQNGQQMVAVLVLLTAVIAPALQIGFMLAIVLGSPSRTSAEMGGDAAAPSSDHPDLEHDRGHDAGRAGRSGQDRRLRDRNSGNSVVRAVGAGFSAGRDAVEFRLARGVGKDPMGGGRNAARLCWESHGRGNVMSATAPTAMQQGLQSCETCGLLSRPAPGEEEGRCPRCAEELVFRKPGSFQRTWAFLIAAAVCYIPANVLPVLTTTTAAGAESDTIMQGVVLLWSPTGWPLSLIVLFASIMIPSAKILALAYLLITAQRGSIKNNAQRIRLYRMVEFIGRWSMVDVFVDTFTAALIQLQPLMSVEPGPGLFFFAAVVVLTMLAVESFDPRLIWDATSSKEVRYA